MLGSISPAPQQVMHPSPYPAPSQQQLAGEHRTMTRELWAVFLTISHIPNFRRCQSSLVHIQESHFSTLMRSRAREIRNQALSSAGHHKLPVLLLLHTQTEDT